jgi:hypothetical protein
MSRPISAMMIRAAARPTPVTSSSRSTAALERGDLGLDLGVQRGHVGAGVVDALQHRLEQESVMVAEVAMEGLFQQAELGTQPLTGPQRSSQRPTTLRAHLGQVAATSAGDQARFHSGRAFKHGEDQGLHCAYCEAAKGCNDSGPDPKIPRCAGRRQQPGEAGFIEWSADGVWGGSGGVWFDWFDNDGLAVADHDPLAGERLELPSEAAGPPLLVDALLVVVGAQVTEADVRVGQQVVDDHQHRVTVRGLAGQGTAAGRLPSGRPRRQPTPRWTATTAGQMACHPSAAGGSRPRLDAFALIMGRLLG